MENPIKMDDLGGTPIFGNTHVEPPFKSLTRNGNTLSIYSTENAVRL